MRKLTMLLATGICLIASIIVGFPRYGDADTPQKEYEPPKGKGRVVVVVSGHSGPSNYAYVAEDLAEQGYYAVLVDGNDFWVQSGGSEARLKGVITRSQ